ncbi:hypothetical protein [Candidatus Dactylopiibacterium carminicum]|uniref:hypothetical protein n=1 Tax=Candidatus Dactylopiibacterium carminicum TaxID=857335 RepID=UPI001CC31D7B|nr:hypothetical protein [Candidatus Dactylopiibacterium carminicum]
MLSFFRAGVSSLIAARNDATTSPYVSDPYGDDTRSVIRTDKAYKGSTDTSTGSGSGGGTSSGSGSSSSAGGGVTVPANPCGG